MLIQSSFTENRVNVYNILNCCIYQIKAGQYTFTFHSDMNNQAVEICYI